MRKRRRREMETYIWCNSGHVASSAIRSLLKQFLHDQLFIYPGSVTQRSWKIREGVIQRSCISNSVTVVCKSCIRHAIRGGVTRRSCSGPFDQSCRVTAKQSRPYSILKVTEQSVCFGHEGVTAFTAFTERRVTGVYRAFNAGEKGALTSSWLGAPTHRTPTTRMAMVVVGVCVCACASVCARVRAFGRAGVMCLQYTIIIFYPGQADNDNN